LAHAIYPHCATSRGRKRRFPVIGFATIEIGIGQVNAPFDESLVSWGHHCYNRSPNVGRTLIVEIKTRRKSSFCLVSTYLSWTRQI